jgi:tetratricopeptide (TPR) repeat protein
MATERLRVILEAVTSQFTSGMKDAASATGHVSDRIQGMSSKLDASRLNAFAKDSIRAATDLEESVNAVGKTFGASAEIITGFGRVAAETVGLSSSQFNQLSTVTGAMLTNFGLSAQEAATETVQLTQRAADMASVFNTDVASVLTAVQAALRGESEPIRRFGVSLDDATVRAKAVAMGLAETTSAVDNNAKAAARLALIYEQTNKVAGDFADTSEGLANSTRIAAANLENAKANFGKAAAPILADALNFSTQLLNSIQALGGSETAQATLRFQENLDAINTAEGEDKLLRFQDALRNFARDAELTTGEVLAFQSAAGASISDVDAFADSIGGMMREMGDDEQVIEEVRQAILGLADPADQAGTAIETLGRKAQSTAGQLLAARNAQRELASELTKAADPVFRAVDAYQSYQQVLETAQEDGRMTADEQLNLAKALLETQAAFEALGDGGLAAGVDAIAVALGVTRDRARELLAEVGLLKDQELNWVIRLTTTRDRATEFLIQEGRTVLGGRQHGGPVMAGNDYLVGERGPEIFRPWSAGRIIPSATSGAGGGSVTVNVNSPTTSNLDRDLAYGALLAGLMTQVVA